MPFFFLKKSRKEMECPGRSIGLLPHVHTPESAAAEMPRFSPEGPEKRREA